MQLLSVFPGTYLIIAAKGGRKMPGKGGTQFFRNHRDPLSGVSEQDDGCGHSGFRFLLLERFLIFLYNVQCLNRNAVYKKRMSMSA